MIKNYWRTALRNLLRTKTFTLINILGLAIGISSALVIYLIVHYDLSFESFQPNKNRIYRVVSDMEFAGIPYHIAGVPYPLPAAARKELTGLREATHIWPTQTAIFTDSHYFKLFQFYTWLAGSAAGLDAPYHAVLTASRATTHFPGLTPEKIIGKTIRYDDTTSLIIDGIVSDPPDNTDISFREFISISTIPHTKMRAYANSSDWDGILQNCQFLIELAPGVSPASIEKQLVQLRKKYTSQTANTETHRLQSLADLHFDFLHQPAFWLFIILLVITVTFLAGFYPSWILSRFQPIQVLRNQLTTGSTTRSGRIRKVLTVSQFVIAQAFIMATIVVGRQLHYTLHADLGFKKDAIINFEVPFTWDTPNNSRFILLDRINAIPGVEKAASAGGTPSTEQLETTVLTYTDGEKTVKTNVNLRFGDTNYRRIYQLPLLAGRDLRPSDTIAGFIINTTYRKLLGFKTPEEAVGRMLKNGSEPIPIVGVIPDFHQASLHTPIEPLALAYARKDQFQIHVALQPQNPNTWHTTIAQIEKAFKGVFPKEEFTFTFFDETIAKYYVAEQHLSKLLRWATGLTILISCLGLAGLVIFTTNIRTREIGIRKVLGASIRTIITLLSKEFVKLLLIAFAIATPVAWWAVHKWLESFAYRAPVSWWIFPLAGIAMMGIALLTMSVRTIRAAAANPVEALRSE